MDDSIIEKIRSKDKYVGISAKVFTQGGKNSKLNEIRERMKQEYGIGSNSNSNNMPKHLPGSKIVEPIYDKSSIRQSFDDQQSGSDYLTNLIKDASVYQKNSSKNSARTSAFKTIEREQSLHYYGVSYKLYSTLL